jgi:hypothetical protein
LAPGKPPELLDLKGNAPPTSLPELGNSTNVLGTFGTKLLCQWNGANQIIVRELRGTKFMPLGSITLASGHLPRAFAYNRQRRLLAWTEASSSNSISLASLAVPGLPLEVKSDVSGIFYLGFSEDGDHLFAPPDDGKYFRVWNVKSGRIRRSIDELLIDAKAAFGGQVLVVALFKA